MRNKPRVGIPVMKGIDTKSDNSTSTVYNRPQAGWNSVYIDYLQLAAVDFYSSTASVTHLINRVMDI